VRKTVLRLIQEGQDSVTVVRRYEALWGTVLLQSAPSAAVGLQQLTCYHQSLDLTGPLIDLGDAGIAVMTFCWHLCHIAHSTQDLDGLKQRKQGQGVSFLQNTATLKGAEPTASITGWGGTCGHDCSLAAVSGISRV